MTPINAAILEWKDNAAPFSSEYGDVYFSIDDGLLESEHVFLHHNHLAERFAALNDSPDSVFTIVETGFGTGLNFTLTMALWLKHAPANARLRFISIEKHPFTLHDLQRAYQLWPSAQDMARQWQNVYPPLFPGRHICRVCPQIELWLCFEDISAALDELYASLHARHRRSRACVNAWFLDGFAPSKNPAMWQPSVFSAMADLSAHGCTFSTFTSAGIVKRGLKDAGFKVKKVTGFGRKRDMLCGEFGPTGCLLAPANSKAHNAPWYISPTLVSPRTAAVVGAGIGGATVARALAERGIRVTVFEKAECIAQNGSGNLQGVIYGKLSHRDELSARFVTSALHFAHHYYQRWFDSGALRPGVDGELQGVVHLLDNDATPLQQAFLNSPPFVTFHALDDSQAVTGAPVKKKSMWVHAGGWLHPAAFCRAALDHPNITLCVNANLSMPDYCDGKWHIGEEHVDVLIYATGSVTSQWAQYLPIKPIRGQVSHLKSNPILTRLRVPVCDKGYIAPARLGEHCIGASFNLGVNDVTLNPDDHRDNLTHLSGAISQLDDHLPNAEELAGRVAFRGTSPDYLPLVGGLVRPQQFCEDFAVLSKDATLETPDSNSYVPGLYGLFGLGSKGLTYAPICAEHLASLICREISPLPLSQQLALNPNRFLLRAIIKNKPLKF
jgi:tRNA 5-methylaminomethyl-2-thiouridine biosynthesis bifunctional protein